MTPFILFPVPTVKQIPFSGCFDVLYRTWNVGLIHLLLVVLLVDSLHLSTLFGNDFSWKTASDTAGFLWWWPSFLSPIKDTVKGCSIFRTPHRINWSFVWGYIATLLLLMPNSACFSPFSFQRYWSKEHFLINVLYAISSQNQGTQSVTIGGRSDPREPTQG